MSTSERLRTIGTDYGNTKMVANQDLNDLADEVVILEDQISRAFDLLETVYGVPKNRAKTVMNGVDVLATRLQKENAIQQGELDYKNKLLEKANGILRSVSAIASRDGRDTNWEAFKKKLNRVLDEMLRIGVTGNETEDLNVITELQNKLEESEKAGIELLKENTNIGDSLLKRSSEITKVIIERDKYRQAIVEYLAHDEKDKEGFKKEGIDILINTLGNH